MQNRTGLVHLYTGNGKAKTTASLGLAFRAVGHGHKVLMIQFLKGGGYTGEFVAASKFLPLLRIVQFGKGCIKSSKQLGIKQFVNGSSGEFTVKDTTDCGDCRFCFTIDKDDKSAAKKAIRTVEKTAKDDDYDMIILDEITHAINNKLVDIEDVLDIIKNRAPSIELVLTGRTAPKELIEAADLVSEINDVKHYHSKGVVARPGVEY